MVALPSGLFRLLHYCMYFPRAWKCHLWAFRKRPLGCAMEDHDEGMVTLLFSYRSRFSWSWLVWLSHVTNDEHVMKNEQIQSCGFPTCPHAVWSGGHIGPQLLLPKAPSPSCAPLCPPALHPGKAVTGSSWLVSSHETRVTAEGWKYRVSCRN